ncbi:uncharacterized protein LOC108031165 [Drosophila biarmipes]|uniref:uncharacterized protein LOC108031165 n=1 Tax=Drosophila biarmipes TaxID=125945 RepID=UPI0007E82D9B|nr:uncharacterized protein LOC108031165 [Drosophila biarmipes]
MSWLSTTFRHIFILTLLLAIWASVHPRWEQMAHKVARQMNFTNEYRIQRAWEEVQAVEKQVHSYYHRKLANKKKSDAQGVLDSAYAETRHCVRRFYEGEQEERFGDCIRHVIDLHLGRLQAHNKIGEGQQASGASRLKVWL